MRVSFWYSPPSTFNNAGRPSAAQAIEFSLSKWQAQSRYELALQQPAARHLHQHDLPATQRLLQGHGGLTAGSIFSWVGNVAWAITGLRSFLHNASPADPTPYASAIQSARIWLEQQITAYQAAGGATGGITDGTEGNVSTYFARVAAGATTRAQAMSTFLSTRAWDSRERLLRMGVNYWGVAIDVMGAWGSDVLRAIHDDARALDGISLAASIFPVRGFTNAVVGMGDIAGPLTPTVESTGQYAAAGGYGAAWLMDQMLLLEDRHDPGAFPGAADEFGGGDGWNTVRYRKNVRSAQIRGRRWRYAAQSHDYRQGSRGFRKP